MGCGQTWSSKKAAFTKPIDDALGAIVFCRRPLSDWDGLVSQWKAAGGDKSAEEFAKEYSAANA